jgi:hypothetical protein
MLAAPAVRREGTVMKLKSLFLLVPATVVLCNLGAQADVSYSKIGVWSVAYLEVGNLMVAVQQHSSRIRRLHVKIL